MNNNIDLPKMNEDNNETVVKKENDGIKEVIKYITTRDTKDLLMLVLRMLIIVAILFICKFPFDLLKDIGTNVFILFGISITDTLLNIWNSIINIIYGILAIYSFYKIVKIRFKNINNK